MSSGKDRLDRDQRSRLLEIIYGKIPRGTPLRQMAARLNRSLGGIHNLLHGGDVTRDYALGVCLDLTGNPLYVLKGTGRKYMSWSEAFAERSSTVEDQSPREYQNTRARTA